MFTVAQTTSASLGARVVWLCLWAGVVFGYGVVEPKHNWDMIGYTASAYGYLGLEGRGLHEAAYADVRGAVDEGRFRRLTERSDFHRMVYEDPAALEWHGYYRSRAGYVLAVLLASLFTGSMAVATYMVSAAAGAVTLLLCGGLLLRQRLWLFLPFPLLLSVFDLSALSRHSTPDMLAAMTAAAVVCVGLRRPGAALLMLPLLPFIRTDYILLVPLFAGVLYSRDLRLHTAVGLALAGGVYFGLSALFDSRGYLEMFNYSFIGGFSPAMDIPVSSDIGDYLAAYRDGLRELASNISTWVILLGALLAFKGISRRHSIEGFTLAAVIFVLLHFALYPSGLYRFYFVATMLSLLTLFRAISHWNKPPTAAG